MTCGSRGCKSPSVTQISRLVALLTAVACSGCVFRSGQVLPLNVPPESSATIRDPVRVHLRDGSTVVFRDGVEVHPTAIGGSGLVYDLRGNLVGSVTLILPEQIAAMESFPWPEKEGPTIAANAFLFVMTIFIVSIPICKCVPFIPAIQ